MLENGLDLELAQKPRIYFDQAQATGVNWPENLKRALLRSKLLVAVWTPPYFRSEWCVAEYHSMLARQKALGLASADKPQGLIYPIVYSDGQHFDQAAKDTQWRRDLREFTCPFECFKASESFVKFHAAMSEVSREIAVQIEAAPPWQDGWPVNLPKPTSETPLDLPRL